MNFANPEALYWLLATPLLVAALVWYWLWKQRLKKTMGHLPMIEVMSDDVSARRQIASSVLVLLAIVLLIFAWSRPQWGMKDRMVKRAGVDVVFALDLSRSMLARDVPPSRLQAAKNEIDVALTKLGGDRVGLVVFTAVSFAQTPLTTDYGAMRFYLRKLQPTQMPVGGTSLGGALGDALELLTPSEVEGGSDVPGANASQRAKSRVVVLITDGEDHESDPMAMAAKAKAKGIKLVTVGLGSVKGGRIPVYRDDGSFSGYKLNRKGEVVYTKLDDKTLRSMAHETGGLYVPYQGETSVAYALIDYINSLEKTELEALMRQSYQDRFMWPLGLALLLMIVAFLLGDRRKPRARRVGEGGDPPTVRALLMAASKQSMVLLLMLGVIWVGAGCKALTERPLGEVEDGNAHVKAGEFDKAIDSYQAAEKKIPATSKLHYNLGVAHHGATSYERSAEFFARALESDDLDLQFDALFNLGLSLSAKEEWKQAYETYQKAVALYAKDLRRQRRPVYAEAIHNMEVVFYKLYPPCSKLEDDQEENDTAKEAKPLKDLKAKDLTLCGLDEDWFSIPVQVGTKVSLQATFKSLREVPDPEHAFLPKPDDLQVTFFDGTGQKEIVTDKGETQVKKSFAGDQTNHQVPRQIQKFTVTPEMLQGGQPNLLLKVWARDSREFKYDIEVKAIPPCIALEDQFEENDSIDQPAPLDKVEPGKPLHLCPNDEDWFTLNLEEGQTLFVDLQAQNDLEREKPPELAMQILGPDGQIVAPSTPEGGFVTSKLWRSPKSGSYTVRVFAEDGDQQGPYMLSHYVYDTCPEGNDRFEANNAPASAKALPKEQPSQRYLRLCPEDLDYFKVPVEVEDPNKKGNVSAPTSKQGDDKPKGLNIQMTLVPTPEQTQEELSNVALQLLSPSGDQVVLNSTVPEVPQDATPEVRQQMILARGLSQPKYDKPEALVRVLGAPVFYHLSQGNQGSSSNDQQQNNKDDQQKDDAEQNENKDAQNDKEDSNPEDSKDGQDDKEKGEEGKEEQKKPEEEQKGDQKDEKEEKKPDKPKEKGTDPEMQRIEDILEALEESDDNFQMRKALEKTPGRYIERDW